MTKNKGIYQVMNSFINPSEDAGCLLTDATEIRLKMVSF